ncbi:MAG: hypothetical protein R3B90_19550 [Planctomycetaceae bacterium]
MHRQKFSPRAVSVCLSVVLLLCHGCAEETLESPDRSMPDVPLQSTTSGAEESRPALEAFPAEAEELPSAAEGVTYLVTLQTFDANGGEFSIIDRRADVAADDVVAAVTSLDWSLSAVRPIYGVFRQRDGETEEHLLLQRDHDTGEKIEAVWLNTIPGQAFVRSGMLATEDDVLVAVKAFLSGDGLASLTEWTE